MGTSFKCVAHLVRLAVTGVEAMVVFSENSTDDNKTMMIIGITIAQGMGGGGNLAGCFFAL